MLLQLYQPGKLRHEPAGCPSGCKLEDRDQWYEGKRADQHNDKSIRANAGQECVWRQGNCRHVAETNRQRLLEEHKRGRLAT